MKASPHSACKQSQTGLSLLEALIAVLLISLALLGLVSLQARTVQLSTESEDVQRASLLANEIATTMWTLGTVSLPPAVIAAWAADVGNAAAYGLPGGTGTVTVNGTTADVTVTWASPRAAGASSSYSTTVMLPTPSIP